MPRKGETRAASKEAFCGQWSRTGVLRDVTFVAWAECPGDLGWPKQWWNSQGTKSVWGQD